MSVRSRVRTGWRAVFRAEHLRRQVTEELAVSYRELCRGAGAARRVTRRGREEGANGDGIGGKGARGSQPRIGRREVAGILGRYPPCATGAEAVAGVRAGSGWHAGARHRRGHGGVQRGKHGALEAVCIPRSGATGGSAGDQRRAGRRAHLDPCELSALHASEGDGEDAERCGDLPGLGGECVAERGSTGDHGRSHELAEFAAGAGRATDDGPGLCGQRRGEGTSAGCDPEL